LEKINLNKKLTFIKNHLKKKFLKNLKTQPKKKKKNKKKSQFKTK